MQHNALVLQGKILEAGSHEELYELGGDYRRRWLLVVHRVNPGLPSLNILFL